MAVDQELLDILVCPKSRGELELVEGESPRQRIEHERRDAAVGAELRESATGRR